MSKGLSLLTVLIAAWAPARTAAAGRSGPRAAALALLHKARQEMAAGDCRKAIDALHRGYKMHHHYVFPLLEGICLLRLDRPLQAKAMLLEAREVAGRRIAPHHKKLIADKLAAVATRLKYDKVALLTDPRVGVRVQVDGTDMGTSPLAEPLVLNRGVHRIKASAPGHRERIIKIVAKGGASRVFTLRLEKAMAPTQSGAHSAGPARKDTAIEFSHTGHTPNRPSRRSLLAKTLLWSGIAGLALGAGVLVPGAVLLALNGRDAGAEHNAPYQRSRYDTKPPGIVLTALGTGLLTVGAAALVASFFLPKRKVDGPEALARPEIGFSGNGFTMGLSGRF